MKSIFRCELCGELVEDNLGIGDAKRDDAYQITLKAATSENGLVWTPHGLKPPCFYSHGVHECSDGSIGLVSFLGFKMEVNPDEKELEDDK